MYRVLISFLVSLVVYGTPQGQSVPQVSVVQVLVLDYKTGNPVKGREVEMILPDAKGDVYSNSPHIIFKKTEKNGIAVFHIGRPVPPHLWVMADFPCTGQQDFETSQVLQQGIIGDHADFKLCQNPTSRPVMARPGEIVLYIRRLNPWLRFERFIWEIFES